MKGRIEVLAGPMFAGKSDELLRRLSRLKFAKKTFSLFKPAVDVRYSKDCVVTHSGTKLLARPISTPSKILEYWLKNQTDVIAIDEAQFFDRFDSPSLVEVCRDLSFRGVRIILAGLDMDASGNPFGLMPELMSVADEVIKLKACCSVCGADASMTLHKNHQVALVELGGADKYEPRCRAHWKNENSTK